MEDSNELGLAVRGYAPGAARWVRAMIGDPLNAAFYSMSGSRRWRQPWVDRDAAAATEGCVEPSGADDTCRFM